MLGKQWQIFVVLLLQSAILVHEAMSLWKMAGWGRGLGESGRVTEIYGAVSSIVMIWAHDKLLQCDIYYYCYYRYYT